MFVVTGVCASLGNRIFTFEAEVHLDIATYNWPWVKTGVLRSTPTYLTDCPWDLLIVIAKANLTGNCLRWKWNPIASSGGLREILGMNAHSPSWSPPSILTSSTLFVHCSKTQRVPLHNPLEGSMFRRIIRGQPILSCSLDSHQENSLSYSALYSTI